MTRCIPAWSAVRAMHSEACLPTRRAISGRVVGWYRSPAKTYRSPARRIARFRERRRVGVPPPPVLRLFRARGHRPRSTRAWGAWGSTTWTSSITTAPTPTPRRRRAHTRNHRAAERDRPGARPDPRRDERGVAACPQGRDERAHRGPKPQQVVDDVKALENTTFTDDELAAIDEASGLAKA